MIYSDGKWACLESQTRSERWWWDLCMNNRKSEMMMPFDNLSHPIFQNDSDACHSEFGTNWGCFSESCNSSSVIAHCQVFFKSEGHFHWTSPPVSLPLPTPGYMSSGSLLSSPRLPAFTQWIKRSLLNIWWTSTKTLRYSPYRITGWAGEQCVSATRRIYQCAMYVKWWG